MSRRPSTTKIGAFIFAGLILIIVSVLMLANLHPFSKKTNFVVYFNASLRGLDIGAPVKFNGVKVGVVTGISVSYDSHKKAVYTPVTIQIDSAMFDNISNFHAARVDYNDFFKEQIENGLAAQLTMDSVLTGKFFIELNYFTQKELAIARNSSHKFPQMPSVSQDFSQIMTNLDSVVERINKVDFEGLSEAITKAGSSVSEVFSDPNVIEIVRSLHVAITNINDLTVHTHQILYSIEPNIKRSISSFADTMDSIHETSKVLQDMFNHESNFRTDLNHGVNEMAKAFRAMRIFLDYLERNPNAIITGRDFQ